MASLGGARIRVATPGKNEKALLEEWDVGRRAVVRKSRLNPGCDSAIFLASVPANRLVLAPDWRAAFPANGEAVLRLQFFDLTTLREMAVAGKAL
jgi:hypothetical protein